MKANTIAKQPVGSVGFTGVPSEHRSTTGVKRRTLLRHKKSGNTWALVLAAGEGRRLQSLLLEVYGIAIPKQFCSLYSGPSLLEQALGRGATIALPDHLCAVVAAQHYRWWRVPLSVLYSANVVVQPENRGTANGILLPLLRILERDPGANVVLLPSDHHVEVEPILIESLRQAVAQLVVHPDDVHVLGIEPADPDPELGYIVPSHEDGHVSVGVAHFVEKPSAARARELISQGGLWNAFIVVARAQALLKLFVARVPEIVIEMRGVVHHDLQQQTNQDAMIDLYSRLPSIDFSRHILHGQEAHLRVLTVPSCGWSDLGTPKRVIAALRHVLPQQSHRLTRLHKSRTACLGEAARQLVLKSTSAT